MSFMHSQSGTTLCCKKELLNLSPLYFVYNPNLITIVIKIQKKSICKEFAKKHSQYGKKYIVKTVKALTTQRRRRGFRVLILSVTILNP